MGIFFDVERRLRAEMMLEFDLAASAEDDRKKRQHRHRANAIGQKLPYSRAERMLIEHSST